MHVDAARRAMIGDIEQRTDTVRHEDLQIGYCERRVAGDPHIGQAGKMRDPLLDRADRAAARYSPDRVDALVWAFSDLLVEPMNGEGIFELYRQYAEEAKQRRQTA